MPSVPTNVSTRNWVGLELASGPFELSQGTFSVLDGLFPYAPGRLEVMPVATTIGTAPLKAIGIWAFNLNTIPTIFIQDAAGAIWTMTLSGTLLIIAAAGSTTPGGWWPVHWKGADAAGNPEAVLWVDTVHGYGSWNGSAWTTLNAAMIGNAIEIYSGRVWIANGTTVYFTGPDLYNDFTIGDFGGSFAITDPTLAGPVLALKASQNWLYLIGSGVLALNNVQVVSVAGSTNLVTTYYLTAVSSAIVCNSPLSCAIISNRLFVCTASGVWAISGLNPQIASSMIGTGKIGGDGQPFGPETPIVSGYVLGRPCAIFGNALIYDELTTNWCMDSAQIIPWTAYCSLNVDAEGIEIFAIQPNGSANPTIVQGFNNWTAGERAVSFTTNLSDIGDPVSAKQFLKVGVEIYQSSDQWNNYEAVSPVPTLALNLVGWAVDSPVYTLGGGEILYGTQAQLIVPNTWWTTSVNQIDRYLGLRGTLTAYPGIAIGTIAAQYTLLGDPDAGTVWTTAGRPGAASVTRPVVTVVGTLLDAVAGVPYQGTLTIVSGVAPFTAALSSGTLPTGLTWAVEGSTIQVSGTCTTGVMPSEQIFTVTDASGTHGQSTQDMGCTYRFAYAVGTSAAHTALDVLAGPSGSWVTSQTITLPQATGQVIASADGTLLFATSTTAGTSFVVYELSPYLGAVLQANAVTWVGTIYANGMLSCSDDGSTLAWSGPISATAQPVVIFKRIDGVWTETQRFTVTAGFSDFYGVSLNHAGTILFTSGGNGQSTPTLWNISTSGNVSFLSALPNNSGDPGVDAVWSPDDTAVAYYVEQLLYVVQVDNPTVGHTLNAYSQNSSGMSSPMNAVAWTSNSQLWAQLFKSAGTYAPAGATWNSSTATLTAGAFLADANITFFRASPSGNYLATSATFDPALMYSVAGSTLTPVSVAGLPTEDNWIPACFLGNPE
jgi:hypothetical protein